jgi:hypothetical protein
VDGGGGADSMLQFQLEKGADRMKYCQKMKCDTTLRRGDVGRRRGGTREGIGRRRRQLD